MVLIRKICPPEQRKAVIAVSIEPSSRTLSISEEDFHLRISLRIAETTELPARPITICTSGTVFNPSDPHGCREAFDTLALGTVGLTLSAAIDEPPTSNMRHIALGMLRPHPVRPRFLPSNLKQMPWLDFMTIPAEGSVEVVHALPLSRMFHREQRLTPADFVGGKWQLSLNPDYVGTTW